MAQRQPPTTPGRLSDTARHVVLPSGIVSTGWPAVRDTCAGFGVTFDEWQDGAGRAILAKRSDGKYACSIGGAVMSIPRQVGKTFLIGAIVFALCLLFPGLTVLWTAHRLRTAQETFSSMQAFAARKKVAPHVKNISRGAGDEAIEFHNGSRIVFGARERGFGRGWTKVGVVVFDEAQILTDIALDDMLPAMNQADNPLPIFTGTPPKPTDPGEVFTRKRSEALNGEDTDTLYIEFSADPDAKPDDRKQWAKANPSYPRRTPASAILRMTKNLGPDSVMREALGVWDQSTGMVPRWSSLEDRSSEIATHLSWALALSPVDAQEQYAAIAKAGRTDDGRIHVETVKHDIGSTWVVPLVAEMWAKRRVPIRIGPGPERSLVAPLRSHGVEVVEVSAGELAASTTALINSAKAGELVHLGQATLNRSIDNAKLRSGSDGSATWHRRTSVDITPLMAATVAFGGVPEAAMPYAGPLVAFR